MTSVRQIKAVASIPGIMSLAEVVPALEDPPAFADPLAALLLLLLIDPEPAWSIDPLRVFAFVVDA